MPLQNRVTPFGEIVAAPWRGAAMGNRGRLHDAERKLGRARWKTRAWITCFLAFRGRERQVMAPGSYTELFFPDEAAAMAAGHRPCAECRRADYLAFRDAFARAVPELGPRPKAAKMDAHLHASRLADRPWLSALPPDLPDGVFVEAPQGRALLRWQGRWWVWQGAEYEPHDSHVDGPVRILTPQVMVDVLRAGFVPAIPPRLR